MNDPHRPALGSKSAFLLFVLILVAFVAESELTQHVQTTLHYRHPFFLFYVVHSSFLVMFPVHFLYLRLTHRYSTHALTSGLSHAISQHLNPARPSAPFPRRQFAILVLAATAGITIPALLWFASVSLAPISDVTAIWNTNAFFAYLFSVHFFGLKWQPLKLVAVSFATLGVVAVVYGGSTTTSAPPRGGTADFDSRYDDTPIIKPTAPLLGDLLTLAASVGYGLYQVLYKKYIAMPSDPEAKLGDDDDEVDDNGSRVPYAPIPNEPPHAAELQGSLSVHDVVYPPPFGLYPNLVTSGIGLCTLLVLWVPLPILHYIGAEPFSLPTDTATLAVIAGIASSGVLFNAGLMILLGVWGPIITSVGNLLTIVLVFLSDVLFGAGLKAITFWGSIGSSVIVAAFAVLAYDMLHRA